MAEIGIVCGLAAEAGALGPWARHPSVTVAVCGARADVAEARARVMVAEGARLLLSWGLAGGLARGLEPGSLVIGSEVIDEDGRRWPLKVPPDRWGRPLLGARAVVASAGEKARLRAESHADSVDLESLAVARIAAEADIPAMAVRAVADPAGRSLPAFLSGAISPDGRPRPGQVLAGLLLSPASAATLWRLRGEAGRGLGTLRRFADSDLGAVLRLDGPG